MTRIIFLITSIIFSATTFAQNNIQVLDSISSAPLAGAKISVGNMNVSTDNNGFCGLSAFSVLKENDLLEFSFVGYKSRKLRLGELKENRIVYMVSNLEILKEAKVYGKTTPPVMVPYKELAAMKYGIYAFGALVVNDKIYVIGGDKSQRYISLDYSIYESFDNRIQVYDINADTWSLSSRKVSSRAYHNVHYYNGRIFILGGKRLGINSKVEFLNEVVEAYDIRNDTVFSSKTNPHQAANFASSLYKNAVVTLGGSVSQNRQVEHNINAKLCSSKAHLFDLKTGYWYDLNNMPHPKETKSVAIDSTIYLIGGYSKDFLPLIDTYNVVTGKYETVWTLPEPLERPALATNGNIIYMFENGKLLLYNTDTNEIAQYLIDLNLKHSEMLYHNNKLYIVGGYILEKLPDPEDTKKGMEQVLGYKGMVAAPSEKMYCIDTEDLNRVTAMPLANKRNR